MTRFREARHQRVGEPAVCLGDHLETADRVVMEDESLKGQGLAPGRRGLGARGQEQANGVFPHPVGHVGRVGGVEPDEPRALDPIGRRPADRS
jgi:hypothetical protein